MPGLKLTPDQEKLWPPVESRGAGSRQDADRSRQCADEAAAEADKADDAQKPTIRWRVCAQRADNMAASAAALKKIADAADPLYKTLDDGQKRRLAMLTHRGHHGGEGWRERCQHGRSAGIATMIATAGRIPSG